MVNNTQKNQKIFQCLKTIISFGLKATCIFDEQVLFLHTSSLFHFHVAHCCKWKQYPTFWSEQYLSVNFNDRLWTPEFGKIQTECSVRIN